jgi:hypothetical protein
MQSCPTLLALLRRAGLVGAAVLVSQGCGGEDLVAPTTGEIAVTVATSGDDPDPDGYTLSLDGLQGTAIEDNASRTLSVKEGSHTLELAGLAANCMIQGESRVTVQVAAGGTASVTFAVLCSTTAGGLTVVTTTAGNVPNPGGYSIALDQGQPQPIGPNASITLAGLAAGDHTVLLSDVPELCSVAGDNPRTATVPAGGVVMVTFAVTCTGSIHQWVAMTSGTTADLVDVSGTSATDVFAAGELDSPRGTSSVIVHYDGHAWTRQLSEAGLVLRGMWADSPSDVYAVGADDIASIARLFHFDGSGWTEVPGFVSIDGSEAFGFESVWGSSATDVFAVGGAFNNEFDLSLIFHFDGSSWQRMPVTGDVLPTLTDVWGTSATDVWAVGLDQVPNPRRGVVLHFDGTAWTPVFQHDGLVLNAVWASSGTNVFTAGFQADELPSGGFRVAGAIWRYDGTGWTSMPLPSASVLHEIWGTSPTDVFAVGEDGVVLHYDGTAWTAVTPTRRGLLGVWGSSPGDAFAVGVGGTILHGTP